MAAPALQRRIQNVQRLDQLRHGIHRNARRKNSHGCERDGIQPARFLIEAKPQIFRHRPRAGTVVERHHEDANKCHGRNRADPIEMAGGNAVLGAGSAHADDFLRTQIGRNKSQPAHPRGNRTPRKKEVGAGLHVPLQGHTNPQHKQEVNSHDGPIDCLQHKSGGS